jgi:putative tricarboxylic transport membrane protein
VRTGWEGTRYCADDVQPGSKPLIMRHFEMPVAPCILRLTLWTQAKHQLPRGPTISLTNRSVLFTHSISLAFLLRAVAIIVAGLVLLRLRVPVE